MAQSPRAPEETSELALDPVLLEQLPTFEQFFKTFGFKRIHGRVWGLLVLSEQPLSSKEISSALALSSGATSGCINELSEWGAIRTEFDSARRCHLHAPNGNTLSIVATVFRRREQVVLGQLRRSIESSLEYVQKRYGERDPRVFTLRSILTSCEIAEAVMQLVFSAVERALGDSESLLSRAVQTALKVGMSVPSKLLGGRKRQGLLELDPLQELHQLEDLESHDDHEDHDEPEDADSAEVRTS